MGFLARWSLRSKEKITPKKNRKGLKGKAYTGSAAPMAFQKTA